MDEHWHQGFWHFWWLIFPAMWFLLSILRMSLRHNARQQVLDVLQTYAAQGKDPPAEMLAFLRDGGNRHWRRGHWHREGRSIVLGMLALAFAGLAFFNYGPSGQGFVIAAVILGALSIGFFLSARMHRGEELHLPSEDQRPSGQ